MTLERRIWRLGNVMILMLLVLTMRVIYWQLVRGDELQPVTLSLSAAMRYVDLLEVRSREVQEAADFLAGESAFNELPQPVIQRTMDLLAKIERGSIYDRNGRLLAHDEKTADGDRFRVYTEPSLAHVVGYVSGIRTGIAGIEESYNDSMLGLNRVEGQWEQITHRQIEGSEVVLTIDSHLQRAAEEALGDHAGAIVVLDARSGEVLAMASAPRFDPNRVLEQDYVSNLMDNCQGQPRCRAPFLNRVTQAQYTPGSTWKTVTLIAALDSGFVEPDETFDFGEARSGPDGIYYVYEVGGFDVIDPNHSESRLSLEMSYAKSANAAFAKIGDEMPADVLVQTAQRLGFSPTDEKVGTLEIESTTSQLANDVEELYTNDVLRAVTAFGQGQLQATPLNMAMVVLAITNNGDMPIPYLVKEVRDPEGNVIEEEPGKHMINNVMKESTAQQVRRMMETVVNRGSGVNAQVPGLTVGGKTGTAEVGEGLLPHAWFIGFAEGSERGVVIAVLLENAGEGSRMAAPIFAQMAEIALGPLGEPVEEVVSEVTPPEEVEVEAPEEMELPAPDVPRDEAKVDFTVVGTGACLGDFEGPVGTGPFVWPTDFQFLAPGGGDFGERHPGIDLGSPPGAPIYAVDAGVVIYAGWSSIGYGNVVVVDHGNGYETLYAHLSQVATHCEAVVGAGEVIGLSGNTGNTTGPHLHFEVRVPGGYLNPWKVLPAR